MKVKGVGGGQIRDQSHNRSVSKCQPGRLVLSGAVLLCHTEREGRRIQLLQLPSDSREVPAHIMAVQVLPIAYKVSTLSLNTHFCHRSCDLFNAKHQLIWGFTTRANVCILIPCLLLLVQHGYISLGC